MVLISLSSSNSSSSSNSHSEAINDYNKISNALTITLINESFDHNRSEHMN